MNYIKIFIENAESNLQKRKSFGNILPKLTLAQREIVMLFFVGFSVKKIAHMRNVSYFTVKNILTSAKNNLGVFSLDDIRSVVLLRVLMNYSLE
ncbi:hypothetical protein ARAF_3014 [Arsenophonus endosymbiont of Aleurodicus floccissimus]|uniref:helix-turn-helix transcriptional regulator n=1 Tax=Arsenophonus endosymbiont of Aleurodicus floccissimus TaxID=2152761 RepID=UPI000E6B0040|nr:sigma-70 family RNA polymerase sigma factor [Arsenophonus endosymbiont of Aleurodicus floccissimus]SPP32647.1 hypothetical protein ARAF_3014 [Arsenophonus endosymbiont of Aleurodicus floccissimus]